MKYQDVISTAKVIAGGLAVGREFTKQKMYEKKEKIHGDDIHSGLNSDSIYFKLKPYPRNVIPTKIYLNENYALRLNSSEGKQGTLHLCAFGTPRQFYLMDAGGVSDWDYSVPAIQLNPNQSSTGGAYFSLRLQPSSEKISLHRMALEFQITNFSSAGAYIDIYVCQAKCNIPSQTPGLVGAFTTWSQCANSEETYGSTLQAFPTTAYATGATVGNSFYQQLGNKPTMYPGFNELWKVLKVHKVVLAGGAEQFLNLNFECNLNFDLRKAIALSSNTQTDSSSTWLLSSTKYSVMKGGISIFAVARGSGVVDTIANNLSTSICDVGFVITRKARFNLLKDYNEPMALVQAQSYLPTAQNTSQIKNINTQDVVSVINNV